MWGSQYIKPRVIISAHPGFWSKTDDPSFKMEHLWKLEASTDPLQIAYFTAHVYDFTEALRSERSNAKCSWLLHPLLMLHVLGLHPFPQHSPETRY